MAKRLSDWDKALLKMQRQHNRALDLVVGRTHRLHNFKWKTAKPKASA